MTDESQLIEDIEKRESRINEWERGFIDSIKQRLENGRGITDAQERVLGNIWEKATKEG